MIYQDAVEQHSHVQQFVYYALFLTSVKNYRIEPHLSKKWTKCYFRCCFQLFAVLHAPLHRRRRHCCCSLALLAVKVDCIFVLVGNPSPFQLKRWTICCFHWGCSGNSHFYWRRIVDLDQHRSDGVVAFLVFFLVPAVPAAAVCFVPPQSALVHSTMQTY